MLNLGTDLMQLLAQTGQRESWLSLKARFSATCQNIKGLFSATAFKPSTSIILQAGTQDSVQTLPPGSI